MFLLIFLDMVILLILGLLVVKRPSIRGVICDLSTYEGLFVKIFHILTHMPSHNMFEGPSVPFATFKNP